MNNEAKININGQDIRMLYTAAAEKGFEDMTGQSSAVLSQKTSSTTGDLMPSSHSLRPL